MWQALWKQVKAQIDSDKVVDTLYFGTFAQDQESQQHYVYCPGPKSSLKLVENAENLPTFL